MPGRTPRGTAAQPALGRPTCSGSGHVGGPAPTPGLGHCGAASAGEGLGSERRELTGWLSEFLDRYSAFVTVMAVALG